MSDIKLTHAGSLRPGSYILVEGEPFIVKDTQTSRPGKHGHAKVRIKAMHMITGSNKEVVKPGHDDVEVPIINKRHGQILSVNGDDVEIMDMESFENILVDRKIADEEVKEKLLAGQTVLYWQVVGKRIIKSITEEA
jgi:translation initiation factor 5A